MITGLFAWGAGGSGGILRQHSFDRVVRTSDNVSAHDFSAGASGGGSCIDSSLDGGHVTGDDGIAERAADVFHRTGEFDVCGFEHRIDADNEAGEPACFQ